MLDSIDLPIFAFNIKLWHWMAIIDPKKKRRAILMASVTILTNICQFIYTYHVRNDFEAFILSFILNVMCFIIIYRWTFIMRNQQLILDFFKEIKSIFQDAEKAKDWESLKTYNSYQECCKRLSYTIMFISLIGCLNIVLYTLLFLRKSFPIAIHIPGINIKASPYFEIIFAVQAFNMIPFGTVAYCSFINMNLTWLLLGISFLKNLQRKLKKIQNLNNKMAAEELKACIEYHNRVIRYYKNLEKILASTGVVEYLLLSFVICLELFYLLKADSVGKIILGIFYAITAVFFLALTYWLGNEFAVESLKVADAVYDINWVDKDKSFRKSIIIMLHRSQKPLQITFGSIYPMSLETLQRLLKAAYSAFTLLRSMQE